MDDIARAWNRRSKNVIAAKIRWTGELTAAESQSGHPLNPETLRSSVKQVSMATEKELRFQGYDARKFYFRRNAPTRISETGNLVSLDEQSAFDGHVFANLKRWATIEMNEGSLSSTMDDLSVKDIDCKPILMCFRGLNPKLGGFDRETLSLSGREGIIADRPVPIVEGRIGEEIWVDPERDFVVLRYVTPRIQMDIDYSYHSTNLWVPASWTTVTQKFYSEHITRCDINPTMDADQFAVTFPPNTLVHDYRGRGVHIEFIDQYGKRRPIGEKEAHDILASRMQEVIPSLRTAESWKTRIIPLAASFGVLVAGVLYVISRYQRGYRKGESRGSK